ncbi:SPOR domain-containing protein [uncultured Oxalicibacterium sp.]|uniref:SPOR domain-containing protein n=1 Tax=uncultured Oxalicibacterium sp. TaxID=1168540 RepID=UPI0025DD67E6|nr:SPOR domain-containing protein [uncultured Oxalicibacterium sp.]
MLKILFGVLLFLNGGLLAYEQGWLTPLIPSSHEPSRMAQQLYPERLTIVVPEAAAPAATSVTTSAASDSASESPANATVATAAASGAIPACLELGNFDGAEAQRFETSIAALGLGDRLARRTVQESTRHIVFIPPLGSKEAADRKAAELAKLGVKDYFVIQDSSPLQWGISLGVFRTEDGARAQLAALTQQGVRTARVGTQGIGARRIAFQIRGLDAAGKQNLDRIKEAFPRQQWRDCA